VRRWRVANQGDIDRLCNMLLTVRLELEGHLARNDSWRALKTTELGSVVAQHFGSDPDEDSKRLHRKLLRTSAIYRAYTRVVEAIRILSEAPEELDPPSVAAADQGAIARPDAKPRVRVKAVSASLQHSPAPHTAKTRAA
jgi:hypothetical protein